MSLCQSLSYILAVLNLRFFSLTPTLCCQIQNGLTAKRIEIQTPATSQMKDILTLFLNINKLPPLEKRNIRMNTRETNSTFFFATVISILLFSTERRVFQKLLQISYRFMQLQQAQHLNGLSKNDVVLIYFYKHFKRST